jgi:hypothetical protein
MPPKPGPPPRPVDRRRVLVRRGIGVGAVLVLLGVGAGLAIGLTRGSGGSSPPVTTIAAPKPFRVIFPEGFTRADMAHRAQVVAGIAQQERGVRPRLSSKTYLRASGPRRIPGFGRKRRPLEGFLFPATYDFLA